MKFGVREICNVAFKCKADNTKIGDRTFMKDELVIYFDTCKTSSLEGSATDVYAQGGRGNPKLVTWSGEKEMKFTFEDALISPLGLSILVGANLTTSEDYYHHVFVKGRATGEKAGLSQAELAEKLGVGQNTVSNYENATGEKGSATIDISDEITDLAGAEAKLCDGTTGGTEADKAAAPKVYQTDEAGSEIGTAVASVTVAENVLSCATFEGGKYYYIDGYVKVPGSSLQVTADKFSDYFYIEAETLFRREADGVDRPAQFVIPKGKVSSNFNIAMANSGDPSTFSFEVMAMPDYIKFDKTKKVLCAINILD